ncbi:glutathione S-transferase [Klebsormidium nitens]|uniref:glutathione transferase n=1 Tax=Klebsormidium nitens TaxID=105231 RepID=A0A1Y1IDL0_KLENI|nr:glutathione S-transferase [Klebsormidium nitens]|eukprot:GAQ86786.1 glutathione S-transferase [Klebsormidium nitens]
MAELSVNADAYRALHADKKEDSLKLYGSWFCPFVQRSWITLEEKKVDYEYIEIDPYAKPPELMKLNPRGLVPTLDHNGRALYESLIVSEYVDETWPHEPKLLPDDTFKKAVGRIWIDHINKKIVPTFYRILQLRDAEHEEAKEDYLTALRELSQAYEASSPEGPFFFGPCISLVDIALAPWVPLRDFVLEHYKTFSIPWDDPQLKRLAAYKSAVDNSPSVRKTLADPEKLLGTYERYAKNTATSEVAKAVNAKKGLP